MSCLQSERRRGDFDAYFENKNLEYLEKSIFPQKLQTQKEI